MFYKFVFYFIGSTYKVKSTKWTNVNINNDEIADYFFILINIISKYNNL